MGFLNEARREFIAAPDSAATCQIPSLTSHGPVPPRRR